MWVGLRKFDCRYGRGKEKGVGLALNQWKQILVDCNSHVLVEVTVLGIFTKMGMRLKGYDTTSYLRRILSCIISQLPCVMMLYHIPEERHPQPHSCDNLRTQKNKES